MVGVKYIASVSFGKDSLAMLLRLLEEERPLDAVVFYDTGMEFEAIYRIRDAVKTMLDKKGIEFVELHPEEPFLYTMFERKVKNRGKPGEHFGYGWCGGPCRWGTTAKLKAINAYKAALKDDVTDYVGIAVDEPQRFEKAKSEGKVLPLVEWGMSESDCLQFCHDRGFHWTEAGHIELYDLLDRVSCWCCANKNLKELRNIYLYMPQYWEKLRALQTNIERPFKGSRNGKPVGIFELEQRFENEGKSETK